MRLHKKETKEQTTSRAQEAVWVLGRLVVVKKVREWCQYPSMEWTQSLCSGQNFCNQTMGENMTLIEEKKKRKKERKEKKAG